MSKQADVKRTGKSARAANARRRAKRRRGRRTLHHLVIIVFVLAAGAVLSLTVFFKIDSVVVTGTDRYLPDEIADSTGIQRDDNLLRIPSKQVISLLLEQYPYIESVDIKRRIPSTVEIEVTQSRPAAALAVDDSDYLLVTREGKVLERGLVMIPEHVPLIKGVPGGDIQPGQYLGRYVPETPPEGETPMQGEAREARNLARQELAVEQEAAWNMIFRLFAAMDETGFDDITNVDITNPVNMKIMYENRMLLELGSESELAYKLRFIRVALDKLHPDAHGTLDATAASKKKISYKPAEDYDSYGYHVDEERPAQQEALEVESVSAELEGSLPDEEESQGE